MDYDRFCVHAFADPNNCERYGAPLRESLQINDQSFAKIRESKLTNRLNLSGQTRQFMKLLEFQFFFRTEFAAWQTPFPQIQ